MSLVVRVDQGELQGKQNKSALSGKTYYTFSGIPYAEPPLGELRFKVSCFYLTIEIFAARTCSSFLDI